MVFSNNEPHERIRAVAGEAPENDDVLGRNPGRKFGMHNPASEKMPTLRAGTMYGGAIYKGQASFYGHNSEKRLHSVQNYIHRHISNKTPYFPDRGLSPKPYTYSGSYHSSYLYY